MHLRASAYSVMAVAASFATAAQADVLIGVGASGTSVWRYDSLSKTIDGTPVASSLGTQIYGILPLSSGDALISSDASGGNIIRYINSDHSTTGYLMSFAGAIYEMSAVSDGDGLVPIAGGQVWRYDAVTQTVPSSVASGLGNFYRNASLAGGDALIASDAGGGMVVRYDGSAKNTGSALMTSTGTIYDIISLPDGDALIPIAGGQVWRYDAATQTVPAMLASGMGSTFYSNSTLTSGDALIASDASGGSVVRYDAATKAVGGALMTSAGTIYDIVSLSDGDALIPISGGQVWRYDAGTQSVPAMVASGLGTFYGSAALSNGDALIASDASGGLLVRYDGSTQSTGGALMTSAGTIYDIVSLPDGDALIYASTLGGSLWRYDAATQSVIGTPLGTFMGDYFTAVNVVPEPGSILSALGGALFMLSLRRRR